MLTYRRVASAKDIASVAHLAQGIWREHYEDLLGTGQTAYMLSMFQSEGAISQQILAGVVYKICFVENQAIGYYAIERQGSAMNLIRIYLRREYRGHGYSREILEDILQQCEGCVELTLAVNKVNASSIAAYQHLGFTLCGERTVDIGAGYIMRDYLMRMPLPEQPQYVQAEVSVHA